MNPIDTNEHGMFWFGFFGFFGKINKIIIPKIMTL